MIGSMRVCFSNVRQAFWDKAEELNYISSQTSRTMYYYRVKEQELVDNPKAWSDGWNGMMMARMECRSGTQELSSPA